MRDLATLIDAPIPPSRWVAIPQAAIQAFADLTGDHEWIHVDVERANREFGGTIAHGYHMLALIPALADETLIVEGVRNGLNYGIDRLRFTNMVRGGARVRMHRVLLSVEPERGGWMTRHRFTLEIEGEERPAFVAEALFLLFDA
nr:MaoC family dehydratase [Sphingomonas colocasiae]